MEKRFKSFNPGGIKLANQFAFPPIKTTLKKFKRDSVEIIGDAEEVNNIYAAIHAGYELALKY